jgi:Na+-transporting methylmalonyl-CoA/oxaloacetate decarboxylase gamma subunit
LLSVLLSCLIFLVLAHFSIQLYLAQAGPTLLDDFPSLLVYQGTGLLSVLLVLGLLWAMVAMLGALFQRLNLPDPMPLQSSAKSAAHKVSAGGKENVLQDPELVAVVAAALHTVIQGPFQIRSIRPTDPSDSTEPER